MEQCNSAGRDLGLNLHIFITLRCTAYFCLTKAYIHLSDVTMNCPLPSPSVVADWLTGISELQSLGILAQSGAVYHKKAVWDKRCEGSNSSLQRKNSHHKNLELTTEGGDNRGHSPVPWACLFKDPVDLMLHRFDNPSTLTFPSHDKRRRLCFDFWLWSNEEKLFLAKTDVMTNLGSETFVENNWNTEWALRKATKVWSNSNKQINREKGSLRV